MTTDNQPLAISPLMALSFLFFIALGGLILWVVMQTQSVQNNDPLLAMGDKGAKHKKKKNVSLLDDLGITAPANAASSSSVEAYNSTQGKAGADQDQDRNADSQSSNLKKRKKKVKGPESLDQDLDTTPHSQGNVDVGKGNGSFNPPAKASTAKSSTSAPLMSAPAVSASPSNSSTKKAVGEGDDDPSQYHPAPHPQRIPSHSTISICTLSDSSNGGNSSGNDTGTARVALKSAAPESGSFDDGWQVVNKRNSAKSANVSKNNSYVSLNSLASNSSSSGLTKKQRENAKKYAKAKKRKELERIEQEQRLRAHRLDQERLAISGKK